MNPQTVKFARRARLSYQNQFLFATDEHGYCLSDENGPVLDPDRVPAVLQEVGVPPALTGATFAESEFAEVDAVRDWYVTVLNRTAGSYFALFLGDDSNYTAAAVLRNAVKWDRTVAWYTWNAFTSRYTDRISRSDVLTSSSPEEVAEAAHEVYEAESEDDRLFHVYDVLVITDFDINDVRDFAIPDILAMIRNRSDFELTTIITVALDDIDPLEKEPRHLGPQASLLRMFEAEAKVFDGRSDAS